MGAISNSRESTHGPCAGDYLKIAPAFSSEFAGTVNGVEVCDSLS